MNIALLVLYVSYMLVGNNFASTLLRQFKIILCVPPVGMALSF